MTTKAPASLRLTDDVRNILERATAFSDSLTLPEQLERPMYLAVNQAIELMGGTWNKKRRCHVFAGSAADVVAEAVATGTILDLTKHFQFFETPTDVGIALLRALDPKPGHTILEPSAGRGALVRVLRAAGFEPAACELWSKNQEALVATGVELVSLDFLAHVGVYDRVLANPPFTGGQDMIHVMHMWECLAPGGRLVSVMCPAWRFRTSTRAKMFRAWVESVGAQWHELPKGSFSVSGTNVNTGYIVADKPLS